MSLFLVGTARFERNPMIATPGPKRVFRHHRCEDPENHRIRGDGGANDQSSNLCFRACPDTGTMSRLCDSDAVISVSGAWNWISEASGVRCESGPSVMCRYFPGASPRVVCFVCGRSMGARLRSRSPNDDSITPTVPLAVASSLRS